MISTDVHDEVHGQIRGMTLRAAVTAVDDTGTVQLADLSTHDDVDRTAIEVHQPYGFSSLPPDDPLTLVMAVGADQGHQVALPLASTSYRFGKLGRGEAVIYTADGTRLHLRGGGNVDLLLHALLKIAAGTIDITGTNGITITGPVTFKSPVTFQQRVTFQEAATFNADVRVNGDLVVTGDVVAGGAVQPGTVRLPPSPGLG